MGYIKYLPGPEGESNTFYMKINSNATMSLVAARTGLLGELGFLRSLPRFSVGSPAPSSSLGCSLQTGGGGH